MLQRVVVSRDTAVQDLYWRSASAGQCGVSAATASSTGLTIPAGETVELGGYFNSLFEFHWRAYTRVTEIALRLRLDGSAMMRVWRDSEAAGKILVWEGMLRDGAAQIALPAPGSNLRTAGRVYFQLTAVGAAAVLEDAVYVATGQRADPVGLTVVFCTFNREREIGACLDAIAADPELVDELAEIVVVNQGRPGLAQQPALRAASASLGGTLRVIEQGNFGGAGGFTRGLLTALDSPLATHVCFIDDDVRIEPESLYRMIAFFRMARPDLALGGHMLDAIRPHMLYEAGAVIDRGNWQLTPLNAGRDLREASSLESLSDYAPMDYNGWWLFGFPLAMARRIGLPLPCFIRGDDVEYGLRLNAAGLTTVALPGVAVWHEPFYVKLGNWQLYYEIRNQLVAAALHLGFRRGHVATRMLKHLLVHLLTFRYFSSLMILRGIDDYLRGPQVLEQHPGALHASLIKSKARFEEVTVPRTRLIASGAIARAPRTFPGFVLAMARILLRNYLRRTRPNAPACRVDVADLVWFRQEHAEHIAVDGYWDHEMPSYSRSREHFRALAADGLRSLWRLWRTGEGVAGEWREAAPALTSRDAWHAYLNMDPTEIAAPRKVTTAAL